VNAPRGAAASRGSRWGPVIGWACIILVMTSWPGAEVDVNLVDDTDKIAHFSVYFLLGVLTWRALEPPRAVKRVLIALGSMYLFGMLDEIHQLWIPLRDASPFDWLADVLGSSAGFYLAKSLLSLVRKRQDLVT